MTYSTNTVVADGTTRVFAVPFQYLSKSDVHVYVNGYEVTGFTWPTSGTVQLAQSAASLAGSTVLIKRQTPIAAPTTTFTAGGLDPANLNAAALQLLYLDQEGVDQTAADYASSLRTSDGSPIVAMPSVASRAGLFLQFDVNGNPVASASNVPVTILVNGGSSSVSVSVVGNGVADDAPTINAALASLVPMGGSVTLPANAKCLINTGLVIPPNCHLIGPHNFVGTPGSNISTNYGQIGGALIINSGVSITVGSGASLRGFLIYRKGMTFPAADTSLFAGTAVTINGDDASVERCQIMGFNKAIYSANCQRPRIEYIWHDNNNGIEITLCGDIPYVSNCHAWPFSTIAPFSLGGSHTLLERSGTAYSLHDLCDWGKLTNCFSFGYHIGFGITNANSCTLLNCGADDSYVGAPVHSVGGVSYGAYVYGTSSDTRIIGFQSAAHTQAGIYVNTTAGLTTRITNCDAWGGSPHGVQVDGGDVVISGGHIHDCVNGVTENNAASRIFLGGGLRLWNNSGNPVNVAVVSNLIYGDWAAVDTGSSTGAAGLVGGVAQAAPVTLASVAAIGLPAQGTSFIITGTTNFGSLGQGWLDREVTLYFASALTVLHSVGSLTAMRLSGSANFAVTAGGAIKLRHNGFQWYEVGRCA